MKGARALREEYEQLTERARALNEKYPQSDRMPIAESQELDGLLDRIAEVEKDFRSHERAMRNIAQGGGQAPSADSGWGSDDRVKEPRPMRTAAEFKAHFAAGASFGRGEEFGLADFLRGVAGMQTTPGVKAALSEGTDSAGGFSVPSRVMPEILSALVPASSVLNAGAGVVLITEGHKSMTQAAIDTIPTAAWRLENAAIAESEPTFRAVATAPKSLAFLFKISRELLADSPGLQAALTIVIAQAFAKELDRVALRGSGTNPEPRGLLNTAGLNAVTNGTNGAALANYANFFSAAQAILQADAPMPTAAIMSPRSLVKLGGLLDTTGQPITRPPMLDGLAFGSTSQIPNNLTVGTSTDCSEIFIGDFAQMAFVMREQVSIQLLRESFAQNGQLGFVCHLRGDIVVRYPKAFAIVTGVRP